MPNTIPQRAMVIVAHPDDAEFTMAGTVALWAQQGCAISYVLCTRGDRGSNDPQVTPWALARIREQEQRAACAILGVQEVVFLDYPDGTLEPTLALRRDLTREIRRFRPEVVLCPDPTVRFYGDHYLNHPDHRAAGSAALDAVFPSAETRYIFPELLAAPGEGGVHPRLAGAERLDRHPASPGDQSSGPRRPRQSSEPEPG